MHSQDLSGAHHGRRKKAQDTTLCVDCIAGKYVDQLGQTECIDCNAGEVNAQTGSTGCTPCERGKVAPTTGSTVCAACQAGQFNTQPGLIQCTTCPSGSWNDDANGAVACYTCPKPQLCLGGATCTTGRAGLVCSKCADGYYTINGDLCEKCPDSAVGQYLFIAGGLILMISILETALKESQSYEMEENEKRKRKKRRQTAENCKRRSNYLNQNNTTEKS